MNDPLDDEQRFNRGEECRLAVTTFHALEMINRNADKNSPVADDYTFDGLHFVCRI